MVSKRLRSRLFSFTTRISNYPLFRDAKQFTGLQDCQAREHCEIEFHNASLTFLNLETRRPSTAQRARAVCALMATVKRRAFESASASNFIVQT